MQGLHQNITKYSHGSETLGFLCLACIHEETLQGLFVLKGSSSAWLASLQVIYTHSQGDLARTLLKRQKKLTMFLLRPWAFFAWLVLIPLMHEETLQGLHQNITRYSHGSSFLLPPETLGFLCLACINTTHEKTLQGLYSRLLQRPWAFFAWLVLIPLTRRPCKDFTETSEETHNVPPETLGFLCLACINTTHEETLQVLGYEAKAT